MSRLLSVINDNNRRMMGERYASNSYSQTTPHLIANPRLKLERGWFLNEERVTFGFSRDPKKARTSTAGNRFEIKIGGVKKQVNALVSKAFDDFIQKQAKCINAFHDTKLISQLTDLVSVRDASQQHINKLRAKLENLKELEAPKRTLRKQKKN